MTEQERLALISRCKFHLKSCLTSIMGDEVIYRIALSALQGKPAVPYGWVYIQFKDASKSQMFRCQIVWTDGLNSVLYDEEGSPLLVSTKSYEITRPAPGGELD